MIVYVLDDIKYFKERTEAEFRAFDPNITVYGYLNDSDFLNQLILSQLSMQNVDDVIIVLDLDVPISKEHWHSRSSDKTGVKFGKLYYEDRRLHGLNIYWFIRSLYKNLKVAILSSSSQKDIVQHTGESLPDDSKFIFLHRQLPSIDIDRIIRFANFKCDSNE